MYKLIRKVKLTVKGVEPNDKLSGRKYDDIHINDVLYESEDIYEIIKLAVDEINYNLKASTIIALLSEETDSIHVKEYIRHSIYGDTDDYLRVDFYIVKEN